MMTPIPAHVALSYRSVFVRATSRSVYEFLGRCTSLFADVALPDLDAALADPLIALANSDLDDLGR